MSSLLDPLVGGLCIGAAAGLHLLLNDSILGISGIVTSTLLAPLATLRTPARHQALLLLSAFLLTATVLPPSPALLPSPETLVPAGALVGLGTSLASGCTSGHGICGLGRLSRRSLAAVATFMLAAAATVALRPPSLALSPPSPSPPYLAYLTLALAVLAPVLWPSRPAPSKILARLPAAAAGAAFAYGLSRSGMVRPDVVLGFLDVARLPAGTWDPALAVVMGAGVSVSAASYLARGKKWDGKTVIDRQLIVGSVLFGVGWGLGGICPGPALFLAAKGVAGVVRFWWGGYLAGALAGDRLKGKI